MDNLLPVIPAKRYFTIGEVSELCGVKPYVLRYWEQEFTQLKPMKRRGNRRYYQHHEVLLIRRIRGLLYDQGFTISGARNQLLDGDPSVQGPLELAADEGAGQPFLGDAVKPPVADLSIHVLSELGDSAPAKLSLDQVRVELFSIRGLLLV
jgi:DNA-binding transcriptional MerR regulator